MASSNASVPRARSVEQLSRDAWLDAAAAAIAEGGFDNVRVLTLAKQLGVTRGSFYWHFQDHAELIASFLDRWRERRLAELACLQAGPGDSVAELRRVLRLVLSEPARNTRRMRVELAVRDFARRDAHAARIVADVDQARIARCATFLEGLTADRERARELALLLYVTTIGGRVVLTGSADDEEALGRIEDLITEFVIATGRPPRG
ncbi:MAG TPA: TetR/AcrR family transcriptional regulator [Woeseiaceae bacterium]